MEDTGKNEGWQAYGDFDLTGHRHGRHYSPWGEVLRKRAQHLWIEDQENQYRSRSRASKNRYPRNDTRNLSRSKETKTCRDPMHSRTKQGPILQETSQEWVRIRTKFASSRRTCEPRIEEAKWISYLDSTHAWNRSHKSGPSHRHLIENKVTLFSDTMSILGVKSMTRVNFDCI